MYQGCPAYTHYKQLLDARAQKLCFEDYYEGQLTFPPTYKYDNGTNTYDTSEKARTPSWTDRVLYKGKNVTLLEYARGDCHISDHKPVRAVFEVKALVMDHPRRAEIRQELFQSQKGMKTAGAPIKPSLPTRPSQKRSDAQITAPIIPSAVSRNIEQPRKPSLPPAPVPALVAATTGTLIDFEDSTPAQTALQQQEPPLGVVGQAMQLISLEDVSKQAPNASANAAVHTSGDGYSSNPALNGSVTQRSGSSHFHQQARGSQQEQQQQSFWWEQQKQQQSQNDSAEQLRRESCRNNPFNEASMTQQHQQQRNSTVALPPWNPLIPTNSGVLSSPVNFVGTPQGTSGSSFISTARTSMSNSSPHNPFFVPTTASINNPPIDIVRGTSLRNSNDPNGNASRHGSLSGSRTGSRPGSLSNVALSSSPHGIDAPRSSGPGKLDPTLLNHFSETG